MNVYEQTKIADGAAVTTWVAWAISHLADINNFLQFIVLLLGVVTGIFAVANHIKRWLDK